LARLAFARSPWAALGWVALAIYVVFAAQRLDFSVERFVIGIDNARRFLGRMFPPEILQADSMVRGLTESLEIAILASCAGIVFSLPLGVLAARNLMPAWVSWTARAAIALFRSFHPVITAILFVKAVGFGALAGVLALIVASMGFISKLFAEAIEEMSLKQVEAVRATGAGFFNVLVMGVFPQVIARFIGFCVYQLDSNLRNSTMVGIVGGGGIGATLFTAYQRFDYDFVLTILLAIIALIMVAEIVSAQLRKAFQ
jgi:phosphonate transport system permease protein